MGVGSWRLGFLAVQKSYCTVIFAVRAVTQPVRRSVPAPLLRHRSPEPLLLAMEKVAEAREAAAGNVNPQVLLAVLGEDLAEVL